MCLCTTFGGSIPDGLGEVWGKETHKHANRDFVYYGETYNQVIISDLLMFLNKSQPVPQM